MPVCNGGPSHLHRHTSPLPLVKEGSSCLWARPLGSFFVDWMVVLLGLAIQCRVVLMKVGSLVSVEMGL